MKRLAVIHFCCFVSAIHCWGQGVFLFFNASAPTHLESIDGPLAGPGIWAQMLAGATPDELSPVSVSLQHGGDGLVGGIFPVTVPGINCLEQAYIQMVAWDGSYWGSELAGVPENQLGRTDIVPHILTGCYNLPVGAPRFTQPAIVPPIPEPSVWALALVGGAALFLWARASRPRQGIRTDKAVRAPGARRADTTARFNCSASRIGARPLGRINLGLGGSLEQSVRGLDRADLKRRSRLGITHNFPLMGDVYSHSQFSEVFDALHPLPLSALAIPGLISFDSDTAEGSGQRAMR
jgi:hypothetical protein